MVSGSLSSNAHIEFEMVDCPFNAGSDFIKVVSLGRIPRDAAVFHVKRGILWAGGIAVLVVADLFERALVTGIVKNGSLLETEIIFGETKAASPRKVSG